MPTAAPSAVALHDEHRWTVLTDPVSRAKRASRIQGPLVRRGAPCPAPAGSGRSLSSKTQLIHPVTGAPIGERSAHGAEGVPGDVLSDNPWASVGGTDPWAGLPDFVGELVYIAQAKSKAVPMQIWNGPSISHSP